MEKIRIGKFAITWEGEWEDKEYPPLCAVRYGTGVYLSKTTTSAPPTNIDGWGAMLQSLDEEAVRTLISPDVQTVSVGDITGTSATVTINLQKFGLVVAPSVGVEYRKVGASTWSRTPTQTPTTIGNISINISGMNLVTNYEARAFVVDPKNPDILSVGNILSFSTTSAYIAMPTVSVSGYPANISTTPTLTTSAFSAVGATDTHASTTWRIKNSGGTVVWESLANTTNKTSIAIPSGHLQPNTAYTFEAIHTGASLGSSAVGSVSATTAITLTVEYLLVGGGGTVPYQGAMHHGGATGGESVANSLNATLNFGYAITIGAAATNTTGFGALARGGLGGGVPPWGYGASGGANSGGGYPGKAGYQWLNGEWFSGGGGGAVNGAGGIGGGGAGGGNGVNGTANTGGGGGGGANGYTNGVGGTGIAIIRYPGTVAKATGGAITVSGGYVYHRFLASGTFTVTSA